MDFINFFGRFPTNLNAPLEKRIEMKNQARREKKKKFLLLRSESDFYFLIEQRLKEDGFELLDIFSRIPAGNVPRVSYLSKSH